MDSFRTSDLARMPISALTIAACIGVFVYQRVKDADLSKVWFSYKRTMAAFVISPLTMRTEIVAKKEVWRIITSAYTHGSVLHLAMNMFTAMQQGMGFEASVF
jgi:membrane associated rhomboid family serine protease